MELEFFFFSLRAFCLEPNGELCFFLGLNEGIGNDCEAFGFCLVSFHLEDSDFFLVFRRV
jgi:hypothetical protein